MVDCIVLVGVQVVLQFMFWILFVVEQYVFVVGMVGNQCYYCFWFWEVGEVLEVVVLVVDMFDVVIVDVYWCCWQDGDVVGFYLCYQCFVLMGVF